MHFAAAVVVDDIDSAHVEVALAVWLADASIVLVRFHFR